MSVHTVDLGTTVSETAEPRVGGTGQLRGLAVGLLGLAAVLVANTALGPLGSGIVEYPFTETMLNQTIGLEVVTVCLVVPLTVLAGVLALREHRAAPFLGLGPAAYSAYMFTQYVVGPEYGRYTIQVLFHTVVFTLSVGVTVWAWTLASREPLPHLTRLRRRVYGAILLLLAAFIVTRYLPVVTDGTLPPEFDEARTFFWSIFLLDLGVVVPATLVAGIALLRGVRLATAALYALLGWYALVPPSVAAMSATMVVNDDPFAVPDQAAVLSVVAVLFLGLAAWVFTPLLRRPGGARRTDSSTGSRQ